MRNFDYKPPRASDLPALKAEADAGDAEAQHLLGRIFSVGEIVGRDWVESIKWYRMAADQGHAPSQMEVGEMYFEGRGVHKDSTEGLKWLLTSAAQGDNSAYHRLASRYERGDGLKQDRAEACFWDLLAMRFYGRIEQLTPEQFNSVEKRIEEWKKAYPDRDQDLDIRSLRESILFRLKSGRRHLAATFLKQPPELIADVTLYSPSSGGRKYPADPGWGCPCMISNSPPWISVEGFPVLVEGFPLLGNTPLEPGETRRLGFIFGLTIEGAANIFRKAGKFYLWEGGIIGEAIVIS